MNCGKTSRLICGYVGDCLDSALRREVEAHLEQCPACRAEAQATKDMISCLGALSSRQSPVDCWSLIRDRVVAHETLRTSWALWLARPVVAVPTLAIGLLLAMFMVWPSQIGESPDGVADAVSDYTHYISAHSRVQRQQAFTDPDVTFIAAELEKASLVADSTRP